MSPLAEIGDKMWTVHGVFAIALLLAAVTSLLGLIRWWLAAPSLALALFGNYALVQEMRSPGMWDAIQHELGWQWVGGSFAAWNAAFVLCWIGVMLIHRRQVQNRRTREQLCARCGYDLTGNTSGICPECGVRIQRPSEDEYTVAITRNGAQLRLHRE